MAGPHYGAPETAQIGPTPASHWKLQSLLPCVPEREVPSAAIKSAGLSSLVVKTQLLFG